MFALNNREREESACIVLSEYSVQLYAKLTISVRTASVFKVKSYLKTPPSKDAPNNESLSVIAADMQR